MDFISFSIQTNGTKLLDSHFDLGGLYSKQDIRVKKNGQRKPKKRTRRLKSTP